MSNVKDGDIPSYFLSFSVSFLPGNPIFLQTLINQRSSLFVPILLVLFFFFLPYVRPPSNFKFTCPILMLMSFPESPVSYIPYVRSDIRFEVEFVRIRPTFPAPVTVRALTHNPREAGASHACELRPNCTYVHVHTCAYVQRCALRSLSSISIRANNGFHGATKRVAKEN